MGIRNNFAQQFTPTCQFLHALTMPLKYIGYTLKQMIAVNTVSVNQLPILADRLEQNQVRRAQIVLSAAQGHRSCPDCA